MQSFTTPLRYPGGKAKLAAFVRDVFETNLLLDGHYAEAYAGGAGIALDLLFLEYASHIHLNDLNSAVVAFWKTILQDTEWFSRRIFDTPVNAEEWHRQKLIYKLGAYVPTRELAFAFFFLNRTNRSGILNGGMIGGNDQTGEWKIDARYNKSQLVKRIEKIAAYRNRISVYQLDAATFIRTSLPTMPAQTLIYLDPPYYVKGGRLYEDHYKKSDHAAISALIQSGIEQSWMVSYDNHHEIVDLYSERRCGDYTLDYSASKRGIGSEVMFFSDDLIIPGSVSVGPRMVNTPFGWNDRATAELCQT